MKNRYALFSVIFLLALGGLRAQQNDLGMWNTFDVEYKLNSKFSLLGTEEFRLRENLTRVNLFYTNLGFAYRYNNHFKISPLYRFIQKNFKDGTFGLRHRVMVDITYKTRFGAFGFSTRTRLQGEIAYPYASDVWNVPEYYWRQKFDLKYNIHGSRFTPYAGMEFRVQFTTPHIREFRDFGFSRTRVFAGCDYEINKHNTVGSYFLLQNDYQVNDPVTQYIIGLEYSLTLERGSKKNRDHTNADGE